MMLERERRKIFVSVLLLALMPCLGRGQEQKPARPQPEIPDAPSASKPVQSFPTAPPVTAAPPAQEAPLPEIRPAGATDANSRDQLFTLSSNVNFVLVPVTVKDRAGHLTEGLSKSDFTVLEDGVAQKMTFFTSDPFPLSCAVVIDLAMTDDVVRKMRDTLPALVGAFSQFDEVSIYTFGTTVRREQDFVGADEHLAAAMDRVRKKSTGRYAGAPQLGGPLGSSGPQINGRPIDPGGRTTPSYTREAKVLNDAILEAANDLARREPTRRKVLFVLSDGFEYGSSASFGEVRKVLLSHQIAVYAIGVGNAALPGYGRAERVHLPRQGYGDILPKYTHDTGGEVFNELSQNAIEQAYSRLTEEARNQYTLGYTTRATPSSTYRAIEVRVARAGLVVHSRDGYYPLPPGGR